MPDVRSTTVKMPALSGAYTIWKPATAAEHVLLSSSKKLIHMDCFGGSTATTATIALLERLAQGDPELTTPLIAGTFPVIEVAVGRCRGKGVVAHAAAADNKAVLLNLVLRGQTAQALTSQRVEALRRARIWILGCDRAAEHGEPLLMDGRGQPFL